MTLRSNGSTGGRPQKGHSRPIRGSRTRQRTRIPARPRYASVSPTPSNAASKKAYKFTMGKPGMILLPGNKAKRYIEIEITKDEDPTIIVP